MTILHLRKINGFYCKPQVVDWICEFDKNSGICINCHTIKGKPSVAFLGKNIDFINQWIAVGTLGGIKYHQIVGNYDE